MSTLISTQNKIAPCLWFNDRAQEAVEFYRSIFKNSKLLYTTYYGADAPMPEGSVLTIGFQLNGIDFVALNGGPLFTFSEAISFIINCDSQQEIDAFWDYLSEGGEIQNCGWLKDKFGVSWQIVPSRINEMFQSGDSAKVNRVIQQILKMIKIDLAVLEAEFEN